MLSHLRIRDLGVISDAQIELSPGLNVVTGETGAGKTMVVTGLGLLLGERADAALVRTGTEQASVDAELEVDPQHPAAIRAAEAGGDVSDQLLISRTVRSSGRSRAFVGGRPAPLAVLRDVGETLVAVHGQADQWRLRKSEQHREMVDDFGGEALQRQRDTYAANLAVWRQAREHVAQVTASRTERSREAQMLRVALAEIDAVSPIEGEEDTLAEEESRLAHADGLRSAAVQAHRVLVGEDADAGLEFGALDLLGRAGHEVTAMGEHDEQLRDLATRLAEVSYLASDVAGELSAYAEGLESDPQRLATVQQRRASITALLRNYGRSTAEVLSWAQQARERMTEIDDSDEHRAELSAAVVAARADVMASGAALSAQRREVALDLARRVTGELRDLAMGSSIVDVRVNHRLVSDSDSDAAISDGSDEMCADNDTDVLVVDGKRIRPRASGLDDVQIMLGANAGLPVRPINKAASGGELSRVMLALELVCADSRVPTYVFDEVDAGVGGAAAVDLGSRLARLAESAQVIVVTHLGQVAAFADRHFVVDKDRSGTVGESSVHEVLDGDRVSEVARMLAGESTSAAARTHAEQLLDRHSRATAVGQRTVPARRGIASGDL